MATKVTSTSRGATSKQFLFSEIPNVAVPRSQFNRSHTLKTAFDSGYLIPIFVDEALPGDTMSMRLKSFMRMATPSRAFMDNLYADFFFFAIPNRLVWDNWEKFCGQQTDPGDSIAFSIPQFTSTTATEESLSDYLGIPIGVSLDFNSLWHRGYNLVFNEWFRDQDLTDSVVVDTDNGPDAIADYVLLKRAKRHDYFTGCRPWTQKGTAPTMPIGSTADVVGDGSPPTFEYNSVGAKRLGQYNGAITADAQWAAADAEGTNTWYQATWDDPHLTANLSTATGPSINEVRESFQIQKLLEKDARAGSRYVESIKSHFGVTSPDFRHQRPEYLGGGSVPININPVAQHTSVALVMGYGTSYGEVGFVKSFTEHCLLLGLVNVRADLTYQEGLDRQFSRQTRYEFYWPSLAHLGEQAVLNKEIYAQGTGADDLVFGYQERWAEYRHKPSKVTGVMRSEHSTPLDVWHLALDFSSLPVLNNSFIEDNPPVSRVLVTAADTQFIADMSFDYKCARPMPTYSVPGLVDHF